MAQTRFRSLPLRNAPARVDRENRVIYGVSAAQAVEALGHGMMLDGKTLEQIVALGNAAKNGIKSRFTHPGLSSDGMGKHLGRMKDFRVEGDKAVGDIYLSNAASKSPDGDLAGYVMDLAEEDSAALGMSIVAGGERVWPLDDGTEVTVDAYAEDDDAGYRPKNATTKKPVLRVQELDAVDVVDEPAANRDGMFSSALWGTNVLAENMFGEFDTLLKQVGMTPEKAWGYALKYFDARGVAMKGISMADEQTADVTEQDEEIIAAVEIENEPEGDEVTQEEYQALQGQLATLQAEKLAEQERATKLAATVETMQREARTARFTKLATGWAGEIAKHLTVLEALGEGSDAYAAYVSLQSALTEQMATAALFSEVGSNAKPVLGTAEEKLDAEARKLMAADSTLTKAKAVELAAARNPELYREHVAEMRGN